MRDHRLACPCLLPIPPFTETRGHMCTCCHERLDASFRNLRELIITGLNRAMQPFLEVEGMPASPDEDLMPVQP